MKYRLVELLASPEGRPLRVADITRSEPATVTEFSCRGRCTEYCAFRNRWIKDGFDPAECTGCYTTEIVEGELISDSGKRFPITGGIPRLLSESASGFIRKNQESFSLEWKYFKWGQRNWGQDIEFRKDLFLKALGEQPANLRNKLIVDAGCGSGVLSVETANSFGLEVLGVDLAFGIEQAYRHNTNPYVHFVQGSVLEPPVKAGVADYVYCAGVLVALPSTYEGFRALTKCVKPGGRFFIWLYHPFERHRATGDYRKEVLYNWIRGHLTSRMPIRLQELLYLALLPFYFLKRILVNPFRKEKEDRTWREKMQNFIDHYSPVYMNRHTEAEAADWYHHHGFENVVTSYNEQYGFGIRGDRPKAKAVQPERSQLIA